MSAQLTDRQQNVYNMIRDLIVKRGYGPTVREIGEHFGIKSPNGVMCHLRALERKGLINRSPNKSRAIELTNPADRSGNSIPLGGIVSAAPTRLAFEPNDRIDFSEMIFEEDRFVVQVSGDSLIEAKIADGDYVIVKRQDHATPGQMAVCQNVHGDSVLRYYYPEPNGVRLKAANAAVETLFVTETKIVGVAVAIVRPAL
ncbi:transcriptional repressor LexA [Novipirellula artificiosorum]|uniref:LexA repressor n=1 Tax=Novipirellula artificiosorum TaxID=2528016 RepID=A0A5C6DT21_9BACT|nr:transcriptional repressor LexA [Novipirellula artificiosorum]TWU40473.1 LexA repressor [Novipirellula artificiosorum]